MAEPAILRRAPPLMPSPMLRALPPAARHILRGAPAVLSAAGDALGLSLSLPACRSSVSAARAALWLGPDERLLLGDEASATETESRLGQALRAQPHSLVDISQRQIGLEIGGAHAQCLLAAGCPLDLDAGAFPVGMCTRTLLAKAEIVLWRVADERFHIEVWRSFAAYVSAVIAEAARDLPAVD